ncbi:MAG: hypothetical protein PHY92_04510 [Alphaproteobacteria bacterium]|nr:hypothetical protein [Alphaproteobacteria bacterium]
MGYLLLEEDLFVKRSIIDYNSPAGQKIHAFLLARAKLLAGEKVDFENNPVAFVMSDSEEPNAFHAPSPQEHGTPKRNEYNNIRYIKNPLNVPVICITKGLIDLVDNIDQLDYVLGHEITHRIIRGYGVKSNSKGEELLSDLHAVDLVYDAGSDPKQALEMEDKFHEYARQHAEEVERRRWQRCSDENETGINWSEILDVHVTHKNTRTALEASLTRLSHLIDDRKPREIDKSVFAIEYSDPVTEFLKANGYENQKAVGKLRILIDCIDHLSTHVPAEEHYQAKLDALSGQEAATCSEDDWSVSWDIKREKERIQESIDGGYKDYFLGQTIEKKYQQKIAALAEGLFVQVAEERQQKHNPRKPAVINVRDLDVYLQNKAYQHVKKNGYPGAKSPNYFDASGIMYTYFYNLFGQYVPDRSGGYDPDEPSPRVLPQIEVDLEDARQRIRSAQEADEFIEAAEDLKRLTKTYKDLSSVSLGGSRYITKLDNLSFINNHDGSSRSEILYPDLEIGEPVPWNNLVEIARTDIKTYIHVVNFLKDQGIEDYRITHGQPFVRSSRYSCYGINAEGVVSGKKRQYDLDYAVQTALVLQAYEYVKSYFENEAALFNATCDAVLNITDADFGKNEEVKDRYDRFPAAFTKAMSFVQLYNSLPQENGDDRHRPDDDSVLSLISDQFLKENPLPGSDEKGRVVLDSDLFEFENPIFQQHFGKDFKERLTERKLALKQQMFDTAFKTIKAAADMWAEASPKAKEVDESKGALWEQRRALEDDDPAREKVEQELESLHEELKFYQAKKETAEGIILNYACGIFEKGENRYLINRLTPQQKEVLADYIVRDEKGIFSKLLGAERYTSFCDFRKVLSQQTERVVSGDYALTDMMQTVAGNLGYEKADTKEALEGFVDAHYEDRWRVSKYAWHLHVFDAMRHLEIAPEINVRNLAKAISYIEVSNPDNYSGRDEKIAQELYQNYVRFVRESRLLELIAKAVDFQKNYEGLAVDEMIETVDRLISLRNQMARQLIREEWDHENIYMREKKKKIVEPEHQKILDILDKNIRGAIRKAQHQALRKDDALAKTTDLFCLYNANERSSSGDKKRSDYLGEIAKKEKTLEKISALSGNKDFWPEDVLDHVKAYVFAKNTFLDAIEQENRLLNDILDKLEASPAGEKKKECFLILLDKNLRASYPEIRERLFDLYSDYVLAELGKDDGSKEYQEKLAIVLGALEKEEKKEWDIGREQGRYGNLLSNSLSAADKYLLLRKVSDKILSQEDASGMIKKACQINLRSEDLVQSYLYGVGVDYLTAEMDRDPDSAKRFIQFLNSKGESKDCSDMSAYIEDILLKEESNKVIRYGKEEVLANTRPINCKILYENFWSAPLEARAVIIARLLKSAVNGQSENKVKSQQSWERVFDLVMDNIIRPDDTSVESRYARDIMHSYIKARSNYEREIILSAMMVANRNIGADAGNVGKALKLFLENMGPAEIKFGQRIASHPNTPESIRKELQGLKNMANIPPRWALYEWIRAENIPEELWRDKYLGEILGSGSYFTTVALGDDDVLRILRPEAREKAAKGFKVLGDTVKDLQEKDLTSDLDYGELTASVAEMIAQAARMARIETDTKIGQKQYECAQEIYNGVEISGGRETLSLRVMDWKARGKNWVIMHRAKGLIFNDLPMDTPEQIAYKKAFAKAYIVFEVRRIISGRKFDHDKTGAQLCINENTNEVGIFDTGAMALREPTVKEQKQLGHVIYDVIRNAYSRKQGSKSPQWINALGTILSGKIQELHKADIDTRYLVEVKCGILALGDFFKALDGDDIIDLVSEIDIISHISEPTKSELLKRMSLSERARLKLFLAGQSISNGANSVVIRKARSEITSNVKSFAIASDVPNKSDWLQQAFVKANEENSKKGEGSNTKALGTLAKVVEFITVRSRKTAGRPAPHIPANRAHSIPG